MFVIKKKINCKKRRRKEYIVITEELYYESFCVPLFLFMRGKRFLTAIVFALLGLTTTGSARRATRRTARGIAGDTGIFFHVYCFR